jgi:DNA-binding NarL/FixJ family response regulator
MNSISQRSGPEKKTRVLVIDDQPIIRERLVELLASEPDMAVCGEADDARHAPDLIAKLEPDLVITGLSFRTSHGLGLVKQLHSRFPRVRILVFSMYDEMLYAERAIRAGARGFIEKRAPTGELLAAIRRVLDGEICLSPKVAAGAVKRFFGRNALTAGSPLEQLSNRELEVLQLIGRGLSTRQVAAGLGVDVKTIETYRARIKVKLNLSTSAELCERARRFLEQACSTRA